MRNLILAFRYFYYRIFTRFHNLGWPVAFGSNLSIRNSKFISIGNRVYLENSVVLQLPGEHTNYGLQKPKLKIEDQVTIGLGTMISAAQYIRIEKSVLISQHCFIGDHDHAYENIELPIRFQGLKSIKQVIIKEGAWIGANTTITSGVTIGKNSVIGANSVVVEDVPDYSVAVGIPAKVVKQYNFTSQTWEKNRSMNKSQKRHTLSINHSRRYLELISERN